MRERREEREEGREGGGRERIMLLLLLLTIMYIHDVIHMYSIFITKKWHVKIFSYLRTHMEIF